MTKLERLYAVHARTVEIAQACPRLSCPCKQRALDAQKAIEDYIAETCLSQTE